MIDVHRRRHGVAREWARSRKAGTSFTSTEADLELTFEMEPRGLLPLYATGFESLPYLRQLTNEGIIEQTGNDQWQVRETAEPR